MKIMDKEEKRYNEMLSALRRRGQNRTLNSPRPVQTQKTPCSSWKQVTTGFQLKSVKQHIPREDVVAPILPQKKEADLVAAVKRFLEDNPLVVCPDGLAVRLDVPDRDPAKETPKANDPQSLEFRAKHLCGGHKYAFDVRRAQYAGCIAETLKFPAIVAEGADARFYLRRYKDQTLHIVIVSLPKDVVDAHVLGVAYQKKGDLVTQYPNIPTRNAETAQVIYKNPNL